VSNAELLELMGPRAPKRPSKLTERVLEARFWDSLEQRIPYRAARVLEALAVCSGPRSMRTFLGDDTPTGDTVELRVRPLGGQTVSVRAHTADLWAVSEMLPPYHLPSSDLVDERAAREIWDLGTNIGMSTAQLALRFTNAALVGVEMDAGNLEMCRANTAPYGARCELVHAAVWSSDGEVGYSAGSDTLAFHVEADGAAGNRVRALSLNTLLAERGVDRVDFVKMDIEGAEREVLRENTEWAASVRAIKLEVHEPYTVDECMHDLRALGFEAWRDPSYRGITGKPPVVALRRD
jgi:FkbM family methyltransferase